MSHTILFCIRNTLSEEEDKAFVFSPSCFCSLCLHTTGMTHITYSNLWFNRPTV